MDDVDLIFPISAKTQKRLINVFSEFPMDELLRQINECLKYLFLSSCYNIKHSVNKLDGSFIPVTKEIDNIWHELILQTKEYQALCESFPGKCFLHHSSFTFDEYSKDVGLESAVKRLLKFLPGYLKCFGPFTDDSVKYWIIPHHLISSKMMSLNELNEMLHNELLLHPKDFETVSSIY